MLEGTGMDSVDRNIMHHLHLLTFYCMLCALLKFRKAEMAQERWVMSQDVIILVYE